MVDSGAAWATKRRWRQLAGLRGLMAKPAATSSRSRFSRTSAKSVGAEYFISTHGGAQGPGRHALRPPDSGYMTRKLVDVSQDVIIRSGLRHRPTASGFPPVFEGEDEWSSVGDRLVGRFACERHREPDEPEGISHPRDEEIATGKGHAD